MDLFAKMDIPLLEQVREALEDKFWEILNIDATIFAEKPKLSPYKEGIRQNIAEALNLSLEQVNIKAKTAEKFGAVGGGEAIAAAVSGAGGSSSTSTSTNMKLGSTGTTLIGDVIESQFKTAYNPNLGAAMSLVLMILIFICVAVMNRFGEGDGEEVIKV